MTDDINFILNITPEQLLQMKVVLRLKKLISRAGEEGIRQTTAYNKCGLGVTPAQFDKLVQGLVDASWCSRKAGRTDGAWLLTINPAFKDVNIPEWEEKP